MLDDLLETATLSIDRFCNRPDGFLALEVAEARYIPGNGAAVLRIDECVEVGAVAIRHDREDDWEVLTLGNIDTGVGDVFAASGEMANPSFYGTPYTLLVQYGARFPCIGSPPFAGVRVTARWGYSEEPPETIRTATIMQAARWFKELEGAMNDALATPEMGVLLYQKTIHPDVVHLLVGSRYVRPAVGRRR